MDAQNDSLQIRTARVSDAPALAALFAELGFPSSADEIAARLKAMQNCGELILVADRQSTALGVLTVHITPVLHRPTPVGRLTALVVTKKARRQGIGRALVEAAEQAVVDRGCALIEVTSNRQLTDAHAFYKRLGYEITSFRMRKSLLS